MSDEVQTQYLSVGGRKRWNKVQTQKVSGFQSGAEPGESQFESVACGTAAATQSLLVFSRSSRVRLFTNR